MLSGIKYYNAVLNENMLSSRLSSISGHKVRNEDLAVNETK